jgi:hypothetical protein
MDLSQFLDVTVNEEEGPLSHLTEDDIVLIDDEEPVVAAPHVLSNGAANNKRLYNGAGRGGPPVKKARRGSGHTSRRGVGAARINLKNGAHHSDLARSLGLKELSAQAVGILQTQNITLKKVTEGRQGVPARPHASLPHQPAGSITWKYRQLPENQYTADIRQDLAPQRP